MDHQLENTNLGSEERRFHDYMQKGDDFMKIQIYRSAKEWYTKALELNHNHELAQRKLDNCNMLLQQEKKIILIIVVVIAIVVLASFLFL